MTKGVGDDGGPQDEPTNKYMALRDAKIARNQARLKELGLDSFTSRTPSTLKVADPTRPKRTIAIKPIIPTLPQRRSERKRNHSETYSTDRNSKPSRDEPLKEPSSKTPRATITENPARMPLSIDQLKQMDAAWSMSLSQQTNLLPQRGGAAAKRSARAMSINVHQLLYGSKYGKNDDKDGCLGRIMERTGKAFVMEESARRSVATDQYPADGGTVSFNKYSGVQEWGNDVLFLWINLRGPNGDVRNDFPNEGRQVTWYGGSQMHDQTNVMVKLKRVGMQIAVAAGNDAGAGDIGASAGSARTDQAIILWCRKYDDTTKTFGPYVCFGRLSLVSYDPTSRPLAFVWQLMNYEELVSHKDNTVRDTFRTMIGNIAMLLV